MVPQSNLLVAAELKREQEAELRDLLDSMNGSPGTANPDNPILPFGRFEGLHFARFVMLEDQALADIHTAYGLPERHYPVMLAFIADFDGSADDFRAELVRRASTGLQRIFSHCADWTPDHDLARWMKEHEQPPATVYGNWLGRTVRSIREDNALRLALESQLQRNESAFAGQKPRYVQQRLKDFVAAEKAAARVTLTPEEPTPLSWKVSKLANLVGVPLILLALTPFLLLYLPIFIFRLRSLEKSDMEIAPRPDPTHDASLAQLEDRDVSNQFSAMGSVKPGLFRRWTLVFLFWLLEYTTRHIYVRGRLSRVSTIHFARWVFLNDKRRLLFASNYDGSLDSYMDDFINKVGWGLNLVFSNGIGYPTSKWLVLDGSKDEQSFKYFLRRHQITTQVWYNANPGLTAFDLKRNMLIREGIERTDMSDAELQQWIALF